MTEKTTRELVRALVRDEPSLNLTDIAARIGVSRERVRQIATEEGLGVPRGVVGYRPRKAAGPPVARVTTGGVPVKITQTVAGTIAELLVAADLSARGFVVFFPLVRSAICDLVALRRDVELPLRIEVRSGHRSGQRIVYSTKTNSPAEHHAVVITGEPVVYRPPLPE